MEYMEREGVKGDCLPLNLRPELLLIIFTYNYLCEDSVTWWRGGGGGGGGGYFLQDMMRIDDVFNIYNSMLVSSVKNKGFIGQGDSIGWDFFPEKLVIFYSIRLYTEIFPK